MDIDADALRWAKLPALERLARSLGVPVPALRDEYARHVVLRRDVARAIEEDRRQAAAEERRVMEKAERKKIAAEIADALGETGDRPRRQIGRIVALMGETWVRETVAAAAVFHEIGERAATDELRRTVFRGDGSRRSLGGVFFAFARTAAPGAVITGTSIPRREFFRCFYDRAPKPREPKPAPAPKAKPVRPGGKKARRDETHSWGAPNVPRQVTRQQRQAAAEVYVVRRPK